jgi:ABC-type transport system substrate-binding protein
MNFIKWFDLAKFKKFFSRNTLKAIKFIPKHLSKTDKLLISGLTFVVLIAGFFLWYNFWLGTTKEVPASGGTLVEGIVGEPKDIEKQLARLTSAGLTRLQPTGEIKGDIAENWEMLDEGKTYQFKLREGFNAQDLAYQIESKKVWQGVEVGTPAENLITFKFKGKFSPFLYISTQPVFTSGPYRITKEEKDRITLMADENYWQGKAHIAKIVIRLYPDEESLMNAAKNHEIMTYMKETKDGWQDDNSSLLEMALPRETLLFFNLKNADLKLKALRQALRDNKPAEKQYNFNLVVSDAPKNLALAEKIKADWALLKINLTIKKYDNITLQKDIIPKRDYDILLYKLDYGQDPDPYPFWHTSQMDLVKNPGGMNLSNYSNTKADKLLEDARTTFDFAVRESKYTEFKKIIEDEVPYIKLSQDSVYYVVGRQVKGLDKIFGFSATDRFLLVNEWFINSKRVKK